MRFARAKSSTRAVVLVALGCGLACAAFAQKKKPEETQVLQLPKELPLAIEGDLRRLTFQVTPLSNKGLLSKQVRDALSELFRRTKGDQILKIRAFVAGSGDTRRVRDLVSQVFADHKAALPVLSLVQAGGLPRDAQVVMEATVAAKKDVNPHGLAFVAAQTETADDPTGPVAPLAARSLNGLRAGVKAAGSEGADVVRISCFLSSLDDLAAVRKLIDAEYPGAAADYVQTQRAPKRALASCEAIARLRKDPGARVQVLNPPGLAAEPGASQVALVGASRVVLTGGQVAYGYEEKDGRLAFQRLEKSLQQAGVSMHDVATACFYPLATKIAEQIRHVRGEFFDAARPPAASMLIFEGLPGMDAGFAVDVVAAK